MFTGSTRQRSRSAPRFSRKRTAVWMKPTGPRSRKHWPAHAASKLMADRAQGVMLDSSVIIAHFRGELDLFQLVNSAEPLFMPLVVLGELLKGALKSAHPAKHQGRIAELLKIVA